MSDQTTMSIRLRSDGHSFPSCPTEGASVFVIELLSPKTTLIPEEQFSPEQAAEGLALAGMPCAEGEEVVWSEAFGGAVAVMAIDRTLQAQLPTQCCFTSPLLSGETPTTPTVELKQYDELLYIRIWNPMLQFAEVVSIPQEEELHYYLAHLAQLFPQKGMQLRCEGDKCKQLRKVAKTYFR